MPTFSRVLWTVAAVGVVPLVMKLHGDARYRQGVAEAQARDLSAVVERVQETFTADLLTYQATLEDRARAAEREAAFALFLDQLPETVQEVTYVTQIPPDCPDPRWVTDGLRDQRAARNAALGRYVADQLPGAEPGPVGGASGPAAPAERDDPR